MLTVAEYAEKIGKPYPTVAAWLRKGKVDGASQIEFGGLKIWQIPEDADYAEPSMGRPPKPVADDQTDSVPTTGVKPLKKPAKKVRRKGGDQ
ncbi:MAG: hypothetical protein ABI977_36160 [Acidobacteriota bacterium]